MLQLAMYFAVMIMLFSAALAQSDYYYDDKINNVTFSFEPVGGQIFLAYTDSATGADMSLIMEKHGLNLVNINNTTGKFYSYFFPDSIELTKAISLMETVYCVDFVTPVLTTGEGAGLYYFDGSNVFDSIQ